MYQKNNRIGGGHSSKQHGDHDQKKTDNTLVFNINCTCKKENKNNEENNNNNNDNNKRVKNIPSAPLTEAQLKVLSHGPNFAVVPRYPPVGKYIASIEHAYSKLKQGEVDELRGKMKAILKKIHPPSITSLEKSKRHWQSCEKIRAGSS